MKRLITLLFISTMMTIAFADSFTDAIQDLAISIACKGTYSATEAGGGWYDDPHDYYTPQMMAKRFAVKKADKEKVKYKKTLGKYSVNERGWKLCHIDAVGLNSKISLESFDIKELESHFVKLANPQNMFLLPLEIGALGEIAEFIEEQR